MKRFSPKNIAWYVGNKVMVPTTSLLGVGAARAVDDKLLEGIVNTVKFPYELFFKGFAPEAARTFIDLADNVIEHPITTLGCMVGGYVVGKVGKMYSEHRRLKKRYTPASTPAASCAVQVEPVPTE